MIDIVEILDVREVDNSVRVHGKTNGTEWIWYMPQHHYDWFVWHIAKLE